MGIVGCGGEAADVPGRPGGDPAAPEDTGPLVIFLGDSIAGGLHLSKDEAFPSVIHRRLKEEGISFRLVIAGGSGLTTAGGATRCAWVLKQEPAVLVVELGANDGLRGVAVSSVEENLTRILDAARDADVPVLLLGIRLPPNYGPDYITPFEAVYERLGRREGVTFVPFFMKGVAGVRELNLPDGIHPTAAGHEKLADNVLPALRKLLREVVE